MEKISFRIGNLLYDRVGRLCKVESVLSEYCEIIINAPAIHGGQTSLPNKPIPLTDEWAVKFGFEKLNNKYYLIELNEFSMSFYYSNLGSRWIFELDKKEIDCKFVHNLQNLYFALTGKELIYE